MPVLSTSKRNSLAIHSSDDDINTTLTRLQVVWPRPISGRDL